MNEILRRNMTQAEKKQPFFVRYKRYILISLFVYLVLIVLLILLALGPQTQEFQ